MYLMIYEAYHAILFYSILLALYSVQHCSWVYTFTGLDYWTDIFLVFTHDALVLQADGIEGYQRVSKT